MTEWPLRQRFCTFNDVVLEAVGYIPNGGRNWVAMRHVEHPEKLEFYDQDDIFDACVFYSTADLAAKELRK